MAASESTAGSSRPDGAWHVGLQLASAIVLGALLACSSGDGASANAAPPATPASAPANMASGNGAGSNTAGAAEETSALALQPANGAQPGPNDAMAAASAASPPPNPAPTVAASNSGFVTFSDPNSDFKTEDVRDADRQIMHFDAAGQALVWVDDGARITGWTSQSNDLSWTGSGVQFRVRFGTENGEQRAYFTETSSGTICNLEVSNTDELSIFGTGELPPNG
jgi:hypothetical protein